MMEEDAKQRLAKRIGKLEEEIRQLKKLIVEEYGTPWWKARSGNVDFEKFYARMLAEWKSDERRSAIAKRAGSLEPIGIRTANVAGKEPESVSNPIRDLKKRVGHLEK